MPEWTRWGFAAVLAVVGAFCLARLVVLRRRAQPHWHEDAAQVLMGVGMIAMFLSLSGLVPRPVWLVLFLGMAAVFLTQLLRRRSPASGPAAGHDPWQHVQHVMAGLAMAYMLAATGLPDQAAVSDGMTGMSGMAGMSGIALSPLAASFGLYFLATTAWSGYQLVTGPAVAAAGGYGPAVLRAPRLVEGCRTVMGLGMAWMFLAMV